MKKLTIWAPARRSADPLDCQDCEEIDRNAGDLDERVWAPEGIVANSMPWLAAGGKREIEN
jgi:hypothetical protein